MVHFPENSKDPCTFAHSGNSSRIKVNEELVSQKLKSVGNPTPIRITAADTGRWGARKPEKMIDHSRFHCRTALSWFGTVLLNPEQNPMFWSCFMGTKFTM